ncbi:unnamed protein product [Plutella xylostella]|uniref:(diamondback moth) hypothetical protein n=1 Tax=Plutella xylostella TaxID=51655 RepID=A0A8S4G990_PLUXY|nr:unnamed protein product [Plutella xylostella]
MLLQTICVSDSSSISHLTHDDDEFIIKTEQHKEGEFLQKLLPGYYLNLDQNPRTLLPKFFGLYCYQCNSKNVRLVAMNNILPSAVKLHQKYDLKGSTYKRKCNSKNVRLVAMNNILPSAVKLHQKYDLKGSTYKRKVTLNGRVDRWKLNEVASGSIPGRHTISSRHLDMPVTQSEQSGLYCYQCNSKNVRLVAMNNILPSAVKLHQKYDLKGSTYKRKCNSKNVRLVAMNNILPSAVKLHQKYDLKGSTYKRKCNSKNVRLVAMNNILPSAVKLHQKYDLKGSTYKRKCNSKNVRLVAMNNILPSAVKLHQKYDLKGSTYKRKCNSKNVRLVAMNNILPSAVKLHQKYDLKGSTYKRKCNSKNVRLVAMNNILPSAVKLHQKYDLKGSTYKRKISRTRFTDSSQSIVPPVSFVSTANKSEKQKKSPTYKDLDFMEHHTEGIFLEADTYTALIKTMQRDCRVLESFKDLDFMEHHTEGIFLEADTYTALIKTMQRDCRVLESFKIMDYSLLVGIHNLDEAQREKSSAREQAASDSDAQPGLHRTRSINRQRLVAHSTAMESIQAESEPIDEEEDVPPGGIPARNARGERLLLFLGIIDILQSYRLRKKLEHTWKSMIHDGSYRLRKKLEHTWKSMIHDGDTVSVHRPSFYAQRFLDFMAKTVFKKIPSLDLPEIKGNHRKFRTLVTSYIALKHSPSKRKSIAKPSRAAEDIDTPGRKYNRTIKDYDPDYIDLRNSKLSPRSSLRSSHSDFTDTTISTWNQRHQPSATEYPSVLSDRLKTMDRDRMNLNTFQRRLDFDSSNMVPRDACAAYNVETEFRTTKARMDSLTEQLNKVLSTGAGSSHINGSLADSGIQTDNTSTSVPQIYVDAQTGFSPTVLTPPHVKILKDAAVDTRNENNLQDIPFIDDEEEGFIKRRSVLEKHKSTSNIPERIEDTEQSHERLSSSLNRAKSPTFVEKFKQFFVDIGLVRNAEANSDPDVRLNTLPKQSTVSNPSRLVRSTTPTRSAELNREASTLPKDMRFRKVRSTQTVYIRQESPVNLRRNAQSQTNEHVSVIKINGEESIRDSVCEKVIKEVVYVSTIDKAQIYTGTDSGSTIIVVPPAD